MFDDGCRNYNEGFMIEQIGLTPDNPPYQKRRLLPSAEGFTKGVKDFIAKTKSFFSMEGIETKSFSDVLGPDKREANDTFW